MNKFIGKLKKAVAVGDNIFSNDIENLMTNEKNSLAGPLNNAFYMRVGDEFHCLRCHKNLPNANNDTVEHVLECEKIHPTTTYCDKSCGTSLLKNCHTCFKLLVLLPGETHTWYCPCTPDKFLSIG